MRGNPHGSATKTSKPALKLGMANSGQGLQRKKALQSQRPFRFKKL
jgi:hypothetical protein